MDRWIFAAIVGTVMFSYVRLFNYNAKRHLTEQPLEWNDILTLPTLQKMVISQ